MSVEPTEDIGILTAARAAWESLREEMVNHLAKSDTYLCLACHKRAQAFVDAVQALSDKIRG